VFPAPRLTAATASRASGLVQGHGLCDVAAQGGLVDGVQPLELDVPGLPADASQEPVVVLELGSALER
jgi:hypothetical protein